MDHPAIQKLTKMVQNLKSNLPSIRFQRHMKTISKIEEVGTIFNIFHDGTICGHKLAGTDLILDVEIQYLAKRISADCTTFHFTLLNASNIEFEPWYDDPGSTNQSIKITERIFSPELEILSAEVEGKSIIICCNQPTPGHGYCGGLLRIEVASAIVQDQAGQYYSLDQLEALSSTYWTEWSENNK